MKTYGDQIVLTLREKQALDFIKKFIETNSIAPTTQELANGLGIKSRGIAHRYIKSLQKKGEIEISEKKWRNTNIPIKESINIIGKIAAGSPINAIEHIEELDLISYFSGPNRYALKVDGDSMIDDGILDGDIVICQAGSQIKNGQTVVALIDKEFATLKKIKIIDDENIALIPANINHNIQYYHKSRVEIQGILLGVIRKN